MRIFFLSLEAVSLLSLKEIHVVWNIQKLFSFLISLSNVHGWARLGWAGRWEKIVGCVDRFNFSLPFASPLGEIGQFLKMKGQKKNILSQNICEMTGLILLFVRPYLYFKFDYIDYSLKILYHVLLGIIVSKHQKNGIIISYNKIVVM